MHSVLQDSKIYEVYLVLFIYFESVVWSCFFKFLTELTIYEENYVDNKLQ